MKEMKHLKKSIISNIQQLFKTENEEPRVNDVNDELMLESADNRNTSVLYLAVRTVLESSVCKQFFLCEESENQSTKIGKLMTDMVTEVVQLSYDNNIKLEDCVNFYHEAILSTLQTSQFNSSRYLRVLPMFVSTFTAPQCKQVLQLVLNGAVLQDEADNGLLLKVLENILPSLAGSHVKSVKLTENGVYTLVNCLVTEGQSSDILLKFFKKFPMLSAQCSERTVDKIFEMTERAELFGLLLVNNENLKVKVAEIIQSADQDWTKADNIKILIKFIQLETGKNGEIYLHLSHSCKRVIQQILRHM
jgi:hypothetical protein